MMIYDNEKLNEIYNDTWPNLGWARKMIRFGTIVKYIGCSKEQIAWGSCDDPNGILMENSPYFVEKVEVHSQHTKIQLRGIKGKFNSVCFEVADDTRRNA